MAATRLAIVLWLALASVAAAEEPAPAQEPPAVQRDRRCENPGDPRRLYFECVGHDIDFLRQTLTRNLAGFRDVLRDLGIVPVASYTAQLLGNPSGGRSTGVSYAGTYALLLSWEAEKLVPVRGLSVNVGAAWSTGRDLSADDVGNVFSVQSAYTAPGGGTNNITLGPMYVQQVALDGALTLAVGRLSPASTFATMPVLNHYVNDGVAANPGSLAVNDPILASYPPGVEWGAQGVYYLTPRLQVAAGIFDTSVPAAAGAHGGHDFRLQQGSRGVLSIAQATYLLNHASTDAGLPGLYTLGGSYDSGRFQALDDPAATETGLANLYVMIQQMVHREGGPGSRRGLTVWAEAALAPRSRVSALPVFAGAGLSYRGLAAGRPDDVASLGAIHGRFSRHLPGTSAETVIEANYGIAATPGLVITPTAQYVIRPAGVRHVPDALVLGVQATISF